MSVMVGFEEDCHVDSGTLALRKMLEELAKTIDVEYYDGKVAGKNKPGLRTMRQVFGRWNEKRKYFYILYHHLYQQIVEQYILYLVP